MSIRYTYKSQTAVYRGGKFWQIYNSATLSTTLDSRFDLNFMIMGTGAGSASRNYIDGFARVADF